MTLVSNDPALWSFISDFRFSSYFTVACSTMVVYDWALSFGQEFKLIWMQRWSFMTVLYICVRYIGILYSAVVIPLQLPVMMTDKGCNTSYFIWIWTPVVVNVILGVIMMTRVYAMYQGSKKMLVFLVIMLLGSTIASAVMAVIANLGISAGGCTFWLPYLSCQHWARWGRAECRRVDTYRYMGDPRLFACSVDCYKTLPWTATIAEYINHRWLFHDVDKKSCILLPGLCHCGLLQPRQHISKYLVLTFRGSLYIYWHSRNHPDVADVCTRTTSDPECS